MATFGKIRNKKGSLLDIVLISIILTVFGVVLLVGFKVTSEINDQIQAHSGIPADAKTASSTLTGHYSGVLDNSFFILTIFVAIAALVLAALVRVHPIFIPIFVIALFILAFICGVLSNIYQEMAENTNLATQADQLTFTSNILEYLPIIVFIFGVILMIVIYKLGNIGVS